MFDAAYLFSKSRSWSFLVERLAFWEVFLLNFDWPCYKVCDTVSWTLILWITFELFATGLVSTKWYWNFWQTHRGNWLYSYWWVWWMLLLPACNVKGLLLLYLILSCLLLLLPKFIFQIFQCLFRPMSFFSTHHTFLGKFFHPKIQTRSKDTSSRPIKIINSKIGIMHCFLSVTHSFFIA